jgi:hypothetical protein
MKMERLGKIGKMPAEKKQTPGEPGVGAMLG